MKLKPVVASIVMLGLMAPALAKNSLPSQQAVVEQNSIISPACSKGWFNRITVSGLGQIVGIVGSHSPAGMFQLNNSATDLYVNNFNLIFDAKLNSWSKATLNVAYLGAPNPFHNPCDETITSTCAGESTTATKDAGIGNRHIDHRIVADEAYVTIGDLKRNPFYFIVGKKYVPFGTYEDAHTPYPMMGAAQMLAQINAVTAIAGVSSDFGLYANIFAFRGETGPVGSKAENIRNFGAKIGYYDALDQFKAPNTRVNLSASYIHNIWDSEIFSPNTDSRRQWFTTKVPGGQFKRYHPANVSNDLCGCGDAVPCNKSEIEPVGGISLHADMSYKAFSLSANYVSAMTDMVSDSINYVTKGGNRSRLWGADAGADYSFKTLSHNSSFGVGVQFSGNGAWIGDNNAGATDWTRTLPRWRVLGEYKVNLFKNTDLSLVATHGKSYDFISSNGVRGSSDPEVNANKTVSVGLARLMVQL